MKTRAIIESLSLGERQSVEFISDCRDIELVGQAVCGFLNTSGGYIVCGVDERGELTGIDRATELAKSLEQGLQQGLSPGALVSVRYRWLRERHCSLSGAGR